MLLSNRTSSLTAMTNENENADDALLMQSSSHRITLLTSIILLF